MPIKVGTRGSDLALFQTRKVLSSLSKNGFAGNEELIKTSGDLDYRPFTQMTGDGFFTKEIERALHQDSIQLAVHSCKDLPSMIHDQLPWSAYGEREDSSDLLIARKGLLGKLGLMSLPQGAKVGTSSPRRRMQLLASAPQVQAHELRGNVPTRIERVARGDFDAIILAKAGVKRLGLLEGLEARGLESLELDWVAAPCQGILAVQTNPRGRSALASITNQKLDQIAKAEKSLLALLGGGCHLPLGARIQESQKGYSLSVFLGQESTQTLSDFSGTFHRETIGETLRDFFRHLVQAQSSHRVWLTQPLQHALKPGRLLAKSGFNPVIWPLTEVVPSWDISDLQNFVRSKDQFGAVAFSSQFAVQIFITELAPVFPVIEWLSARPIFAVGPSTQKKLADFGVNNVIVSQEAHARSLAETISRSKFSGRLLVPGQVSAFLKKQNLGLHQGLLGLTLYKTKSSNGALTADVPAIQDNDRIVLTSPSAAREFVIWCRRNPELKKLKVWAFGPSTSKELEFLGVQHKTNPTSGSWDALTNALSKEIR